MEPTDFPEANINFGPPKGFSESQVRTIRGFRGQVTENSLDGVEVSVVAWKPSEPEIVQMIAGSPIYLTVIGGLPPHSLSTKFPGDVNGPH